MKYKNHLFFGTILILMVMMSSFTYLNNSKRLIEKIEVNFESQGGRFLTDFVVNKLLIQKNGVLPWKTKDSLVLGMLETFLENNPYVDNAEVFQFKKGVLGVAILEKKAVIRIQGTEQFYLDKDGNNFPISKNYTPQIPLFLGEFKEDQKNDLLSLTKQLSDDPFIRTELASIQYRSNSYFIYLKSYEFEVEIGQIGDIAEKISKLKVFCAYYNNHSLEKKYSLINLKFKNQVVGS